MLDKNHIFSDRQAITVDAASTNAIKNPASTHQIDQAVKHFKLMVCVAVAWTTGTSVVVSLQDSADGVTYADTIIKAASVLAATLIAGYVIIQAYLPAGLRQYLQVYYDVTGTFDATSLVNAWIDVD